MDPVYQDLMNTKLIDTIGVPCLHTQSKFKISVHTSGSVKTQYVLNVATMVQDYRHYAIVVLDTPIPYTNTELILDRYISPTLDSTD